MKSVAKSRPKNAEELRAHVDSLLAQLPEEERLKFVRGFTKDISEIMLTIAGKAIELRDQLKRHRKPAKNAARDAEIMRLRGEGKTAGQIVLALKGRFTLTDKSVNAVISREKRKSKAK